MSLSQIKVQCSSLSPGYAFPLSTASLFIHHSGLL
uniref:Uncharacterized protein n=1 Tax=Anguilla anguilla TaxID=7936 RepID=A0A0E9QVN9_ANGAN